MHPAEVLWDFMLMKHQIPTITDVILHLGNDTQRETMRCAADIWHAQTMKPLVIVSGKGSRLTERMCETKASEAARFGLQYGIPTEYIYREEHATNISDNIRLSLALLAKDGIYPRRVVAVQPPFMERHIWGTFKHIVPSIDVCVTSPQVSLTDYSITDLNRHEIISTLVGTVSAIMVYGGTCQIPRPIPSDVKTAFLALVADGYTEHLRQGYEQYL